MSRSTAPAPPEEAASPANQRLRWISALVLAAAALALLTLGTWPFFALVSLAAAVASWEWDGLTGGGGSLLSAVLRAALIVTAVLLLAVGMGWAGLALIGLGALACAFFPDSRTRLAWSAAGILYIGLPALALVWLRFDHTHGWFAVLFLFLVVWASDSGAYFVGRFAGGPRLAPRLSPNKTWSGAVGGMLAAAIASHLFALWLANTSALALSLVGMGLSVVAQLGDLTESAIKRTFGVKDSSHLIPGHGGLLDRIDALLFAALAGALIALLKGPVDPGRALLIWS